MDHILLEGAKVEVNVKSSDGRTPLCWAVERGMLAVVKHLVLHHHVKVECDEMGHNAICSAACFERIEVMDFFIQHFGRRIVDKPCDNDDGSLLLHAICNHQREMTEWLINDAGANVKSARLAGGFPALHYAALKGLSHICQILLSAGMPVDVRDSGNCTPLHAACNGRRQSPQDERLAIVRLLM